MIDVGFAELHDAVFVGGKNLSAKLDSGRYPELKMVYDKSEKELLVTWNSVTAFIPSTNIKSYIPGKARDRFIVQPSHPIVANISQTAQVETPFGHVHQGPGKGKSGAGKK